MKYSLSKQHTRKVNKNQREMEKESRKLERLKKNLGIWKDDDEIPGK
jgi:hypothetical protein